MKKALTRILGGIVGLILFLTILVYSLSFHPADVQSEPVSCPASTPELTPGAKVTILTWNVQFMAGKKYFFFYGGGPDTRPKTEDIVATTKEAARVILEEKPDIILLQEVDHGAKRTDKRDQLADLLKEVHAKSPALYPCHASAFYWKTAWNPHPKLLGSTGMKLSTVSRFKISKATRYALSGITSNDVITRQFNLKRALLETRLPVKGANELVLLNTHLSAFAQGTNTMELQVKQAADLLDGYNKAGLPWILGGDFNLLPPGKSRSLLSPANQKKFNPKPEIAPLYEKFVGFPTLADVNGPNHEKWRTFLPNNPKHKQPTYTIDYFFVARTLKPLSHRVRHGDTHKISDHMPLFLEFQLP